MRRSNVERKIFSNKAQKSMFGLVLLLILSILTIGITIAFFTDSDFSSGYVGMSGEVEIEAVGDADGNISIEDKVITDGEGNTTYQSNLKIEPTGTLIPNMPLHIIANCKVGQSKTKPLLRAIFSMDLYREVGGEDVLITLEGDVFNLSTNMIDQFNSIIIAGNDWYKFTDGYFYYIGDNAVHNTNAKYTQLEEIMVEDGPEVIPFIDAPITFPSFVTTDYSGLKAKFVITFEAIQNFIPDASGNEYFYDDNGTKKNNTIEFSKYIFDDERDEGITANTLHLYVDNVLTSYELETGSSITNTLSSGGINITDNNSLGWYRDRNLIEPVDNSTIVTKGMTLYTYMATPEKLTFSGSSVSVKSGATGNVVIPKKNSNTLITSISANGFKNSQISKVFIPQGVTTIGANAFDGCSNLSIVLFMGDSALTTINAQAFYNCSLLQSVLLPKAVNNISSDIFGFCDKLTSLRIKDGCSTYHSAGHCIIKTSTKTLVAGCISSNIPSDGTVTIIGDNAFKNLTNLTNINIPSNITTINSYAFYNCDEMDSVYIPSGATSLGSYAFAECDELDTIEISNTVNSLDYTTFCGNISLDNIVVSSANSKYHSAGDCLIQTSSKVLVAGCRGSIIPTDGSVTSIGEGAFFEARSLTTIAIPYHITTINAKAFQNCDNLTSIYIYEQTASISSSSIDNAIFKSDAKRTLTIYTNASAKLSGWGSYWDSITSANKATVEYSSSYAHYLQCVNDIY